ncbi:MAG: hypothetical protein AAF525_19630 [Pseudomonadota bacterium]
MVGFLTYLLTLLLAWTSMLVFLSVLLKYRILVVLAGLAMVAAQGWVVFSLPLYLQVYASIMPGFGLGSDIHPEMFAEGDFGKMVLFLILTAAFITLTAWLHPRRDGTESPARLGAGLGFAALGVAIYIGQIVWTQHQMDAADAVVALHSQHAGHPRTDIERISGDVTIERDNLSVAVDLSIAAPARMDSLLFTLNPGLTLTDVRVDGEKTPFDFNDGLLRIEQGLDANDKAKVSLAFSGIPDNTFGYLDAAIKLERGDFSTGQLGMLGYTTLYYHSSYVALLPGSYWLPVSGSGIPSANARDFPTDYFGLDLNVTIPTDWQVAGPGRREPTGSGGDSHSFRFAPGAAVPGVGLMASEFERRSIDLASGLTVELLISQQHADALTHFDDVGEIISETLNRLFTRAADAGLSYPYAQLTVVETPSRIRTYGGTWRMDTTQAPPGLLLMRESAFPSARFDAPFTFDSQSGEEAFSEQFEGGLGQAKVEALMRFSENDFNGGNVFQGAAKHFFEQQTSAHGEGALALNFMLNDLVTRLLTERQGYFSPHLIGGNFNSMMQQTMSNLGSGNTDSVAQAVLVANASRASVWDRALESSLASLDTHLDPEQVVNVMALKSAAITEVLLDAYTYDQLTGLLSSLINQYRGTTFTADEFHTLADAQGLDLTNLLGDWLNEPGLPGFMVSPLVTERLQDADDGSPQYQTTFHVRNGESTPGLVRFHYMWTTTGRRDGLVEDRTQPIRVAGGEAVEIGIVTGSPVFSTTLNPYLSLNRRPLPLKGDTGPGRFAQITASEQVLAEPFTGARTSTWHPDYDLPPGTLSVDDLDAGFRTHSDSEFQQGSGRNPFLPFRFDMDQGLPAYQAFMGSPSWWARNSDDPSAVGKYRHTMVMKGAGTGESWVAFDVSIPESGRWRLEYHMPQPRGGERRGNVEGGDSGRGTYDIQLLTGNHSEGVPQNLLQVIEFDSGAAKGGWNRLGDFDLSPDEVTVKVTDKTSGSVVFADAIRWHPLDETATAQLQ